MSGNEAHTTCLLSWRIAIQRADLPPLTKLICLNLALHTEVAEAECWPSIAEQMRDTGLELNELLKHLRIAQKEGYLTIDQPIGLEAARHGPVYRHTFPGSIRFSPASSFGEPPPCPPPLGTFM
jgi:hypothetical protein